MTISRINRMTVFKKRYTSKDKCDRPACEGCMIKMN